MTRAHCSFLYKNADTTCMRITWLIQSHQEANFKLILWGSGSCERVFEDQDDRVSSEEHLWDEPVLVHRLSLLLPWVEIKLWWCNRNGNVMKRTENIKCKHEVWRTAKRFHLCQFLAVLSTSLSPPQAPCCNACEVWEFSAGFYHWIHGSNLSFQYQAYIPIKSLDSSQQLLVIPAVDENLGVVLDRVCEDPERSSWELLLLLRLPLLRSHVCLAGHPDRWFSLWNR